MTRSQAVRNFAYAGLAIAVKGIRPSPVFVRDDRNDGLSKAKTTMAPISFVDISSVVGVELRWTRTGSWRPRYLIHTTLDKQPVMWVGLNHCWKWLPARVRCHAFEGEIKTEWNGGRPSSLDLVSSWFLSWFGAPVAHRCYDTLRSERGNDLIAVSESLPSSTFQDWRAEITAHGEVYHMRQERLPARMKVVYNGDKIVAFDGHEDLMTAIVDWMRPERCTIVIARAAKGVEAVLAFLFLTACEMEMVTGD